MADGVLIPDRSEGRDGLLDGEYAKVTTVGEILA
jgi:hypothetical protein